MPAKRKPIPRPTADVLVGKDFVQWFFNQKEMPRPADKRELSVMLYLCVQCAAHPETFSAEPISPKVPRITDFLRRYPDLTLETIRRLRAKKVELESRYASTETRVINWLSRNTAVMENGVVRKLDEIPHDELAFIISRRLRLTTLPVANLRTYLARIRATSRR